MLKRIICTTLLLAALAALAGCKSVTPEQAIQKQCDENRAAIEKHIKDPGQTAAMLAVIDSFEAEVHAIASDSADARKRYDAALRDYGSTEDQLVSMQQEVASCLERLCLAAESHSLELRKQCSAEEWDNITAHYHKLKNVTYF